MGQKGLEKSQILTALGVYNIPRDTLEVIIPTTLEVYNIPGNTLKISSIPTADNTLEVYCIPGNVLEVYNIPNTRDNFADNFDTCAGSFDRLTYGCMRISGGFQQCNFGNYNPFALGNIFTEADSRTNIFSLNSMEKHISQFNFIYFAAISIFTVCLGSTNIFFHSHFYA